MKLTLKERLVIQTIFKESSDKFLVEETKSEKENFQNVVFVTIFFPTNISDTAVKKTFLEFGEAHELFDSKFKKPYNDISSDKRHIRITAYKTKHNLLHEIFFDDS